MVKSIAEEAGIRMPSFFGDMLYSGLVLIPLVCHLPVLLVSRGAQPTLFLLAVLLLEPGYHGRICQRGGVAQRLALGDIAQEAAHDLP